MTTEPLTLFGDALRVAIVGSREYADLNRIIDYIRTLPPGTTIVSGGARGVDATAEGAAIACGLSVIVHKPDWKRYGQLKAPLERNKLIARGCDRMVAFWDGHSRGTRHAIDCARRLGKPVEIIG